MLFYTKLEEIESLKMNKVLEFCFPISGRTLEQYSMQKMF